LLRAIEIPAARLLEELRLPDAGRERECMDSHGDDFGWIAVIAPGCDNLRQAQVIRLLPAEVRREYCGNARIVEHPDAPPTMSMPGEGLAAFPGCATGARQIWVSPNTQT
jgi:hypothetical protein